MSRLLPMMLAALLALVVSVLAMQPVGAARVSDVRNTKHNLSASGPGSVKASSESQICVFCHTPHAAETIPNAPLWNRKLSGATYTTYSSSSIEAVAAELAAGPGGSSKLCLSCHDGTMAISSVNVLNGEAGANIDLTGAATGGLMPATAATTGFTRNLGVNLTNDHPISFTYNASLASNDGELRSPDGTIVGTRSPGIKPTLPLEGGKMQCATCHDPHLRETDTARGPAKFLRLNRFQESTPAGGAFSEANDIMCLACHDKGGQLWALSAHAHPTVADELYTVDAANLREFPTTAPGMPVWKAACLNCHDTHTVQGSRRLLREGTDGAGSPKAGGNPAIEETCYQCHSASGASNALANVTAVPNIKSDFALARRMPITSTDQGSGGEAHDIGSGSGLAQRGKDFVEAPLQLGKGAAGNRHVECTDCHNPHRVTKNRLFNASAATPDVAGTHNHAAGHTNIASGVLRGAVGVEPIYGGAAFGSLPTGFEVKRGDGGAGASTAVGSAWVTREYQVCLKCHSTYAYDSPPALGDSGGGTPSGTNGMTQYTDQAMEFQAPAGHKGAPASTTDSGAFKGTPPGQSYTVDFQLRNWRAWHPVMDNTGRTHTLRGTGTGAWRAPWNATADVGTQTMYCSDCHGSNTRADSVDPNCTTGTTGCGENGAPWGPHGSSNNFLLKGEWSSNTTSSSTNALCLKCHQPNSSSGFRNSDRGNLHAYHQTKIGRLRCTWCHVAVPHGWKNRSFLVNLNDVGPEAGLPAGTQVRNRTTAAYNAAPYYVNALLKIRTFGTSGSWAETNCGSVGAPGNGTSGRNWMRDSTENCETPP